MQKHTRSTLASMQSLIQNIEKRMTSFAPKEEVALNLTSLFETMTVDVANIRISIWMEFQNSKEKQPIFLMFFFKFDTND